MLIILNLDAPKACRHSDIPLRIINEKADIFTDILHSSFINSIYRSEFPLILKVANIPLSLKRMTKILRKTVDQSAYFQTSQKPFNDAYFIKFPMLWISIYQSKNVYLEKWL